jgi:hypothetical protein
MIRNRSLSPQDRPRSDVDDVPHSPGQRGVGCNLQQWRHRVARRRAQSGVNDTRQ